MRKKELEIREFIRHYSETYVRIKRKKGEWEFAYFRGGDYESSTTAPVSLRVGGKDTIENLHSIEIDTSFPKFGIYPHSYYGECGLLVSRYPARQWRWGLCKNNIHVTNIFAHNKMFSDLNYFLMEVYNERIPKDVCVSSFSFDDEIAKSILMPSHTNDYHKSVKQVSSLEKSVSVINHEMMVTVSPNSPDLTLWRYDSPVALLKVSNEAHKLKITAPLFAQEVADFYSRMGITNVEIALK